jgi:hypothetical protein
MPGIYWNQIKTILTPGLGCMSGRTIATDDGVFEIDLSDYQSVKRLHEVIAAALNGWERQNKWPMDRPAQANERPGHASRQSIAGGRCRCISHLGAGWNARKANDGLGDWWETRPLQT